MAMKYIDGRALDGLVASQGPLPLPVVLTVLRATARAMAYAHEHGIVHRDIKGANILIDRNGRVIVSDFGIARAMESAALTATGLMIGTPHYMSPEQCAGKVAGAQADQYALGIVAYQLLTGAVPFDGESLPEILQQHCFTPAPDPSIARPDSPAILTAIVHRLLAKEPEQRFGSTADLVAALDNIPFTESERAAGESALKALVRARSSLPPVHPHPLEAGIAPHVSGPVSSGANGVANRTSPSAVLRVSDLQAAAATRPISMDPAIADAKTVTAASAPAGISSAAPHAAPHAAPPPARTAAPVSSKRRIASRPAIHRQPSRPMRWPAIAGICLATCLIAGFAVAKRYTAEPGRTASRPHPDAALLRRYGHRAYAGGDYEIARRFYVRAIRLDPVNHDAQAQQELGCALVKLGSADSTQLAHPVRKSACNP